MTKCFLHGGYVDKYPDTEKAFYDEIFQNSSSPTIIVCPFGKELGDRDETFKRYSDNIRKYIPEAVIKEMKPETVEEDIAEADFVCFTGGLVRNMKPYFESIDLESLLKDKIVFADSGGHHFSRLTSGLHQMMGYLKV